MLVHVGRVVRTVMDFLRQEVGSGDSVILNQSIVERIAEQMAYQPLNKQTPEVSDCLILLKEE